MIIQFQKEKNSYRRGTATEKGSKVTFTIGETSCETELLLTESVDNDFIVKLIEVLLMGTYVKITYNGIKFFRLSNVREVMDLAEESVS